MVEIVTYNTHGDGMCSVYFYCLHEKYGVKRYSYNLFHNINYVMANTLYEIKWDGASRTQEK